MVIPIHDSNPTRRTPVVTYALLTLNVAAFVASPVAGLVEAGGDTQLEAACATDDFFRQWGAIPRELLEGEQLPVTSGPPIGPGQCSEVRPDFDKEPVVSAFTAMFLHGGWLHLLGNMLYLYVFGNNVEDRLGRVRFLLFYLLCGLAATYGFAAFDRDSTATLVGASGAIAGVLGAYLWLYPRARVVALLPFLFFLPFRFPAWAVLGSWFVIQYFYFEGAGLTEATGVAYGAHVIGFAVGFLLVLPVARRPPDSPRARYDDPRRRRLG